ncbi:glutathione peroxidase [Ovoidimarina sediminis]|uniref:glutathione peroxidase n=1 Tax=Ovoidimarina sediminis TaxID=3079856 RepID=UPI0029113683|nr:glutathione peroxidase [Rhodophyticola sp. MJ-SS7]MDU8946131.1 glutathione peroxidase [Rhodophyticola sp. MJ-SS7]
MLRLILCLALLAFAGPARAIDLRAPFDSIDGGTLALTDWAGQPVLVVNTASQCAFTRQYRGLQDLYNRYRSQGLVVLAVPSDDFNQELDTNEDVKAFCELQYGIDIPMTTITSVKGAEAHPFYASLRDEAGFVPRWNFNKVLIGRDGRISGTFGSFVGPLSADLTGQIEAELAAAGD